MVLAVLQGASELFPVSSLGHTVLIPALLRWPIDRSAPDFLAFVVALHLGTALALVAFYRHDWARIARGWVASIVRGRLSDQPDEKLAWLLVAGTVPVAILGAFFERPVRALFGSTALVAGFLTLNGLVMFAGERLRRARRDGAGRPARRLASLAWADGAKVGFAQSAALLPGISRSGASIVAGLLLGLTHDDAARYSFLLATPVIGAAALFELPHLFAPAGRTMLLEATLGGILAGGTAYASVAFLTRYFHTNDLRPFGWYCLLFGLTALVLVSMKVIS